MDVATTFEADVVLSPPRILGSNLEPVSEPSWPIHLLLSEGNFTEPMLLNQFQAFALANDFGIQGLLGSSASNLYRSAMLREFPFPTTFGHAGDTAWGCENALRVRIAVCPDACADFIQERDGGALADSECAKLESKLLDLTRESIANAVSTGLMSNSDSMVLKTLHQGWCRSRNWMLEQVIHSEHVNSVSKQRAACSEDLQIDGAKWVALIEEHSTEVARLQGELFRIETDR